MHHRELADDVYKGYFIAAASYVYANARAMTTTSGLTATQMLSIPTDTSSRRREDSASHLPVGQIGFGCRICVGQHLAEASVWIAVASILSTLNLRKAVDAQGKEITSEVEMTDGLTSHPKSFRCRIEPRGEEPLATVRAAAGEAEGDFS